MSAVLAEFGFDAAPTFKVTQLDLGLRALAVEPQDVVLGKTEFPVCLRTLSHALLLTQLAHRDILRCRTNLVAIRTKRT